MSEPMRLDEMFENETYCIVDIFAEAKITEGFIL